MLYFYEIKGIMARPKKIKETKLSASNNKKQNAKPVIDKKGEKAPTKKPKKKLTAADKKIQKIGNDANRSLSRYLKEIGKFEPLEPKREVVLA